MKIVKWILTASFWILIIALLMAPLGLIWQISQKEMEEYATPEAPVLRETAVGGLAQATRQDVPEYISVSGTFISTEYAYMELNTKQASSIRWVVGIGDEVQEGQVLGTYKDEAILSTVTGILVDMSTYSATPYLRFRLFAPVELEARVDDRTLSVLKRSDSLTTEKGEAVTLSFASMQKNADGTTDVRLTIDSEKYTYGQALNELRILTGVVYQKALVLPADCVYQKTAGDDEPWYARLVTADGIFLREVEVGIGYSNGDLICVSGISEGDWFDTGYKAILGG